MKKGDEENEDDVSANQAEKKPSTWISETDVHKTRQKRTCQKTC